MNFQRLIPVLLTFASALPVHAQAQPQQEVASMLQGASMSLENYRKLAREINCDDATDQRSRDSCNEIVQMLASDVNES